MSEYQQAIQTIANRSAVKLAEYVLEQLADGPNPSVSGLEDAIRLDDHLEQWMTEFWTSLTDSSNEYWRLDKVTPEDKMIVFRKLKKDVGPVMDQRFIEMLQSEAKRLQSECMEEYENQVNEWCQTGVTGSRLLSHLQQMQADMHHLSRKAAMFQRLQAYLAGKGAAVGDVEFNAVTPSTSSSRHAAVQGPSDSERLYYFERKLRGGIVTNIRPQGAFVPESEIRRQGIEHGDLLRMTKRYRHEGQTRYEFELAEKKSIPQPERIQVSDCIVKQDASMYFVDSYLENDEERLIRLGETPHRILIKEEDAKMFRLKSGERVDIAYWANHPTGAKVIWKHMDQDDNAHHIA